MSDQRQSILDRITLALLASPVVSPGSPALVALPPATPAPDLLPKLLSALESTGATCQVVDSPVAARLKLVAELQNLGVKRLLAWDGSQLPIQGVLDALDVLGIEALTPTSRLDLRHSRIQDLAQRQANLSMIANVELGLASADAASADTGTLAYHSGPGRSHLVAHLPRRLILLLPVSRIVPTIGHWLATQTADTPSVVLLTGPGYAYDVELAPAVGVHGPRYLDIMLIQQA